MPHIPESAGSDRSAAPMRRQQRSRRQVVSGSILALGTLLALASLAGPEPMLRIGVVVAIAAALGSIAASWREITSIRRQHAQDLLALSRRHRDELRMTRQRNDAVLKSVSGRAHRWRQEVDRLQSQVNGLRQELITLRLALGASRHSIIRAEATISGLRETLRDRDTEIALIRATEESPSAAIYALPRRVADGPGRVGGATERTGIAVVRRGAAGTAAEPTLPNFEADRRGA